MIYSSIGMAFVLCKTWIQALPGRFAADRMQMSIAQSMLHSSALRILGTRENLRGLRRQQTRTRGGTQGTTMHCLMSEGGMGLLRTGFFFLQGPTVEKARDGGNIAQYFLTRRSEFPSLGPLILHCAALSRSPDPDGLMMHVAVRHRRLIVR